MRSLNLDQLRALIEVTELGSFSAAARRLSLTQPAISLQIRELEQRFRVKLVERMGRTAHATAPGRELVEHARQIFRACDAATSAVRRYHDDSIGRVQIGSTLTALTYQLPAVLRKLRLEHPGIDLMVTNMSTRDTVESILQNKLDLGLVTLPVDDAQLRVTPLRPEMLVAILPASTPDIPDKVTPEYAARQALVFEHTRGAVSNLVTEWLSGHFPLPAPPMHLGTVEAMKKVVGLGLGMSIVPDVAVAEPTPDIVVRPLDPPLPCTLALVEHRCKPNERALEVVRNALLDLEAMPRVKDIRLPDKAAVMVRPQPAPNIAALRARPDVRTRALA